MSIPLEGSGSFVPLHIDDAVGVVFGADPDDPINLLLELIGRRMRVTRVTLARVRQRGHHRRIVVDQEWLAPGTPPHSAFLEAVSTRPFQWLSQVLAQKEELVLESLEDLPARAIAEATFLEARGTTALLAFALPLLPALDPGFLLVESGPVRRPWFSSEIETARKVARLLNRELVRREQEDQLLRAEERHQLTLSVAGLGAWEWRPGDDHMYLSDSLLELLGLPRQDNLQRRTWWLRHISAADRPRVRPLLEGLESGQQTRWTTRFSLSRGGRPPLEVHETGRVVSGSGSEPTALLGVIRPRDGC